MTAIFSRDAAEAFTELPEMVADSAALKIDLLLRYPHMYQFRQFGIMRGYRCFVVRRYLFYYSVSSTEVRILAILPGGLKRA